MKLPTNCENGILHTYRRKPSLLIGFSANENESVPEKVCLIATQTQCVTKGSAGLVLQKEGDAFTPSSQSPSGTPSRFARYVPVSGAEPLAPGLYDLWVCDDGENCSLALDNDPVSAGDSNDAEPDRSGDDPKIDGTVEVNSDAATSEEPIPPGDAGQPAPHRLQVCIHHFLYPVLPCPPAASAAGETEAPQPGTIAPPSEIVVGPDGKLCFFVDDTIDKKHYEEKYEIRVGTNRTPLEPKSARGETDEDRVFWLEAKLQKPLPPSVTVYYNDNNHSTSIGCCTLRPYNSWGTKLQPILVSFLKDIALGENRAGDHSGKLWKVRADYPDIKEDPVVWNIKNRTQLRTFLVPEDLDPAAQAAQMTIAQLWRKEGLCYWSKDDELGGQLVINSQGISDGFTGYDKLPAEWQLQSKLSEWLSIGSLTGNKGSFLALHLHHPVVFPLWGGDNSFQSALLNILGVNALSAASDTVHYAVSLWQHLECVIESDPEVRYWFSKADTDLHFDYVTDFMVYTDNPYVRGNELYARLRDQKQVILYGPPGTGKTYRAKTQTEWMIDWRLARDFGNLSLPPSTRFWKMIQFHPAYTYEDFIQGLRPTPQGGALAFEVKDGHFKAFCESAGIIERLILEIKLRMEAGEISTPKDLEKLVEGFNEQNSAKLLSSLGIGIEVSTPKEGENWELKVGFCKGQRSDEGSSSGESQPVIFQQSDFSNVSAFKRKLDEIHLPPFVFIIDEINRANLSAVLGELMYCLEYRGPEHARKLPLAHLQTEDPVFTLASRYFFVPRNVFVVGTMNTIDKSTERVDFALRRRFGWWKCDPEPWKADAVMRRKYKEESIWDWTVRPDLEKLNEKLRDDLRRMGGDFQIGETYFFDLPKYGNTKEEALTQLWELQLRPVLEDFYGDARQWEKNEAALRNIVVTGATHGNDSLPSESGGKDWGSISKVLKIKPQAILYGPPGTGKTWAVSEDEGRKNEIPEERFELIQFHPAYTYEDFLQGLRPIPAHTGNPQGQPSTSAPVGAGNSGNSSGIRYEVRPGLFKRICRDAGRFERGLFEILAPLKEGQWGLREKDKLSTDLCCSEDGTHNGDGWKNAYGLGWVWCGRMNSEQMSVFLHIDHGDSAIKLVFSCSNQTKLKFPSPIDVPRAADLSVTFDEVVDHVLNAVADKLPRWLLVIDEINRADLAAVFGELMYCLEYRGPKGAIELPTTVLANQSAPQGQGSKQGREGSAGNEDESTPFVTLNGREMFFVPSNLWIVGTMNTIDRSTEPVDFAMRRRFAWVRFEPRRTFLSILSGRYSGGNPGILSEFFPELINQNSRWARKTIGIHIVRIARKVNKQLESDNFPSGYRIGETYYFRIAEIMKAVEETCQFRDGKDSLGENGIHAKIHYGPFDRYRLKEKKDATPATVLFKHHIEPLLEDFHQQQSRSWESEREKYVRFFQHNKS